jgi:hypothetical protein
VPGRAIRSLDIMSNQIMESDLKLCGLKNELSILNSKYELVKVKILRPSKELVQNPLDFSPSTIVYLESLGYQDAKNGFKSL